MSNGLARRPLGRTGVDVSLLCLGGWHIASIKDEAESIRLMHRAIDDGINFFDNAWDYHEGYAEDVMGRALEMGNKRQQVFLMTKNCARDALGTRAHLEDSLRRLRTDVIDLWQFHEINYDNDPEWIMEHGGLAEAIKAQREGKIRFLGFTGHKSPHIFRPLFGMHAWDTVQFPVNVCDRFYRSFELDTLATCKERGIGAIGMKSMGGGNAETGGRLIAEKVCTPEEAIRYALSQAIDTLVVGIDSVAVYEQNMAIAQNFVPYTEEEIAALRARVRPVATDGRHECFKSTQNFDGPYHRHQHGFV